MFKFNFICKSRCKIFYCTPSPIKDLVVLAHIHPFILQRFEEIIITIRGADIL